MTLERTDYYMSKSRALQELIWENELIAQQKVSQVEMNQTDLLFANVGNMQCAMNS